MGASEPPLPGHLPADQQLRDGLAVVDKDAGWTSHDVAAKARGILRNRKVGHSGTLDPDATGVLLVGLGRATRLLRYLSESGKAYRGRVVFGIATSTLDAAGEVVDQRPMPITGDDVERALPQFVGDIEQLPPMVSAVKIGGRRLLELARAGEEVERAPRPVHVDRFALESFQPGAYPEGTFVVECGSGTYVRSLAADLGAALGGCAHLAELRRLRVGSFTLEEARSLADIEAAPDDAVLPLVIAMRDLERVDVDQEQARAVSHGVSFACGALEVRGDGPYALVGPEGTLLAVYDARGSALRPAVVVAGS
ncbi:MAG: tRNA pseudouridine(55) synthase TruB [Acidimicrobiales bacterium]